MNFVNEKSMSPLSLISLVLKLISTTNVIQYLSKHECAGTLLPSILCEDGGG